MCRLGGYDVYCSMNCDVGGWIKLIKKHNDNNSCTEGRCSRFVTISINLIRYYHTERCKFRFFTIYRNLLKKIDYDNNHVERCNSRFSRKLHNNNNNNNNNNNERISRALFHVKHAQLR